MRKAVACLLPIVLACAGACAERHGTNRQKELDPNSAKPIREDLAPYATPNKHGSSGTGTVRTEKVAEHADMTPDQRITADVRRAIDGDASLSPDAKNVTVSTDDGVVKLEGPVASKRERKLVAEKATQVAGVIRVDNRTEVRPVH